MKRSVSSYHQLREVSERNAELEFQLHSLKTEQASAQSEMEELRDKRIQELLSTLDEKVSARASACQS